LKPIVIKRDGSKASFSRDRIQSAVETAANDVNKEIAIYTLNLAIAVELQMCEQDNARHANNILMFVALLLMLPLCRRTPRVYSNVSDALFRLCLKRPKNRSPPIGFNY
jgi:ribonucleoside-triphosphate reductase